MNERLYVDVSEKLAKHGFSVRRMPDDVIVLEKNGFVRGLDSLANAYSFYNGYLERVLEENQPNGRRD